jgi:hypothetical protein
VAKVRSPWRLLRPLLLAGAVTATWLTLSSSAASAEATTDSGPLLGGVTSSISSLTAPLAGDVSSVETKAPLAVTSPAAPASSPGLLQPLVDSLGNTTDPVVAAVPVAGSIVPSGTVSAVAIPVAAVADNAVAVLVEVAVPPLVEAAPILAPVVQPVTELVTGATPLPAVLPSVLDASLDLPAALVPETAVVQTDPEVSAPAVLEHAETSVNEAARVSGPSLAHTGSSAAGTPGAFLPQAAPGAALTENPSPSPSPAPAAPGSGTLGGASPSGPSAAAAWLNDFDLHLPLPGYYPIGGASEHAPSPVSFDPGSSPD